MSDANTPDPLPERDAVLEGAGARLRSQASPISASAVEASALRSRTRRMGLLLGGAVAAIAVLGGALVVQAGSDGGGGGSAEIAGGATGQTPEERAQVENLVPHSKPGPWTPRRWIW